jgi:endonuclease YncB( thermonuclease family)
VPIGLLLGGVIGLAYLNYPDQIFETHSPTLTGRASVVDGDTIEIHGERIRLSGIDAPEHDQQCKDGSNQPYACGRQSADILAQLLGESTPTRCEFVTHDSYGRFVGNCYRADGLNVAELIASKGWAMDWPRHSNGAYALQQETAKAKRIGLWAGTFQPPWEWRAEWNVDEPAKIVSPMRVVSTGKCSIKGNISFTTGERIYHVPGQIYYSVTRINTSKGERWFCSEAEARAAGWRRSRS